MDILKRGERPFEVLNTDHVSLLASQSKQKHRSLITNLNRGTLNLLTPTEDINKHQKIGAYNTHSDLRHQSLNEGRSSEIQNSLLFTKDLQLSRKARLASRNFILQNVQQNQLNQFLSGESDNEASDSRSSIDFTHSLNPRQSGIVFSTNERQRSRSDIMNQTAFISRQSVSEQSKGSNLDSPRRNRRVPGENKIRLLDIINNGDKENSIDSQIHSVRRKLTIQQLPQPSFYNDKESEIIRGRNLGLLNSRKNSGLLSLKQTLSEERESEGTFDSNTLSILNNRKNSSIDDQILQSQFQKMFKNESRLYSNNSPIKLQRYNRGDYKSPLLNMSIIQSDISPIIPLASSVKGRGEILQFKRIITDEGRKSALNQQNYLELQQRHQILRSSLNSGKENNPKLVDSSQKQPVQLEQKRLLRQSLTRPQQIDLLNERQPLKLKDIELCGTISIEPPKTAQNRTSIQSTLRNQTESKTSILRTRMSNELNKTTKDYFAVQRLDQNQNYDSLINYYSQTQQYPHNNEKALVNMDLGLINLNKADTISKNTISSIRDSQQFDSQPSVFLLDEPLEINMEQILQIEKTLQNIKEEFRRLKSGSNYVKVCKEYIYLIADCEEEKLERVFKEPEVKRIVKKTLIFENFVVNLIIFLSLDINLSLWKSNSESIKIISDLTHTIHYNFKMILLLIPEPWAINIPKGQLRNSMNLKDQDCFEQLKSNFQLSLSSTYPLLEKFFGLKRIVEDLFEGLETGTTQSHIFALLDYFSQQEVAKDNEKRNNSQIELSGPFLPKLLPHQANTYTLVLDLDETLIHYNDPPSGGYVLMRPFLKKFLAEMSKLYEVVVFTVGVESYADWVIEKFDDGKWIHHKLCRQHAVSNQYKYVKDLSKLGRDIDKTIIIDNVSENFRLQPENGILIKSWFSDTKDTALEILIPLLTTVIADKPPSVIPVLRKLRETYSPLSTLRQLFLPS